MYSRLHKRYQRLLKRLRGLPPAVKLTAGYLTIIMMLSIGFSVVLYNISANQLHRGLRRPPIGVDAELPQFFDLYERTRLQQLFAAESELRSDLIIFNTLVFVGGGAVSYLLAKRTIRPIEEALEAQKRFTADASHELRTPLTTMQTEIEVALREPKLKPVEARALLQSNLDEVIRIRSLVDGLLRLARNGGVEKQRNVAVGTVVRSALRRSAASATDKSIKLSTKISSVKAEIDRAAIEEVLVILLDNAIKYSPANTTVTVRVLGRRERVVIEVVDQGIGIVAADAAHIFERFYRGDKSRTKQSVEGFGLGLSIAKQIVDAHKGALTVHPQAAGTMFRVSLPSK